MKSNKEIIFIVFSILFLICLMARWMLYLQPAFLASSLTGHMFDTRFWYSVDEGYKILNGFSDESFRIYNEFRFWDLFLPIVYCYLSIQIFSILPNLKKKLVFIPISAMVFDYLENIFVNIVMIKNDERLNGIMAAANISGSIKTVFQYATWLLIPLVFLGWLLLKLKNKYYAKGNMDTFEN